MTYESAPTMHPTVQEVARILRAARKARGLSQRELGDRIGLTQAHISKFESGRVDLRLSSLVELSRGLGLEVMLVPRRAVPAVLALGLAASEGGSATGDPADG